MLQAEDPVKGTRMLRLAAEAGYSEGMYAYGMALCKGVGVAQNAKTAYDWFEKAAQTGHAKSMLWAGMLLGKGMGVQRNTERANSWIDQARDAIQQTQNTNGE
jgi:TPR repeat protein